MKSIYATPFLTLISGYWLSAQVLPSPINAPPAPQPTPAPVNQIATPADPSTNSPGLGHNLPFIDPGSETASWDGKMWNVTNNRMFKARLEKYLATPEANTPDDEAYRAVLDEILQKLSPAAPDLTGAVALLPAAASFPIDAKLSDSLANAIFGVWLAQKNISRLNATNKAMEARVRSETFYNRNLSRNAEKMLEGNTQRGGVPADGGINLRKAAIARDIAKLVEYEAKIKANEVAIGSSLLSAKMEFQALILQFAMQRRFEHVIMACRIYRHLFANEPGGMITFQAGSTAEKMFVESLGNSPTVSTLDSFANEMIRDVDEAVQAFDHLIQRQDLASAAQRISEALLIGEYLPRVRRVPMEKKLQVLDFTRDSNQLISAMEMKDYTLAEELVKKLRANAKDFDYTKPLAAIETARTVSDMHLNKAKVAAMQGKSEESTQALTEAAQLWPTNPRLREFTAMIGDNADIKTQALLDLDRLLSQKNYRQIFNDQGRFLASVLDDPSRQEQLQSVLMSMHRVNMTVAAAQSHVQNSNAIGAWEMIEKAYEEFPDDPEITKMRSDLSVQASNFVSALQRAKQHEHRQQYGSSLAWFLQAKQQYPPSQYAQEGIQRLVQQLATTTESSQQP